MDPKQCDDFRIPYKVDWLTGLDDVVLILSLRCVEYFVDISNKQFIIFVFLC